MAQGIAAASGEDTEVASLRLAQRISVTFHRANARAILRRTASIEVEATTSGTWGAQGEEAWC